MKIPFEEKTFLLRYARWLVVRANETYREVNVKFSVEKDYALWNSGNSTQCRIHFPVRSLSVGKQGFDFAQSLMQANDENRLRPQTVGIVATRVS